MLSIDGAQGEGGGQILRTSLALAALTSTPIRIERIRANRNKPGLLRQHLTAFRAIAEICGADVEGAALGARSLVLRPGPVRAGEYHFAVGTAGSASLVFQTVLWPLLFADGPSSLVLEGGTHNSKAPPFDFIEHTFLPLLRRMGAKVSARLERHGFYPAGGGRFVVQIEPCKELAPIELLEPGEVLSTRARALVGGKLPLSIAKRELAVVRERLGLQRQDCEAVACKSSRGPGNALHIFLERPAVTETITAFGERGVPAEQVAAKAVEELERYLAADVPVSEHLADQLLIPMALCGQGAFCTTQLSLHTLTNIDVVTQLLGRRACISEQAAGRVRIELSANS